MIKVFKELSGSTESAILVCGVDTVKDLEIFLGRAENSLHRFYFLNEKGEEVDKNFNLIIKPGVALSSMVGALQNKFGSKKK